MSSLTVFEAAGDAATDAAFRSRAADQQFDEVVEDLGFLFVDGRWVNRPYRIQSHAGGLVINGIDLSLDGLATDISISDGDDGAHPRDQTNRRSHALPIERGAGRSTGFSAGWAGPTWRASGPRIKEAAPVLAGRIAGCLSTDGIVLLRQNSEPICLVRPGSRLAFLEKLISRNSAPGDSQVLIEVSAADRGSVKAWLDDYRPPPELQQLATGVLQQFEQQLQADRATIAALQMVDQLNYPLTITGMLLGILALGHILKWTARMAAVDTARHVDAASVRYAEIALLLMLGMSLLDLVWTAIAFRAGIMREMNPLAARFVASPTHLVLFKLAATGLGGWILYQWRRRAQVQQATWWMCLVCVLLTFRWVVFDSVLH